MAKTPKSPPKKPTKAASKSKAKTMSAAEKERAEAHPMAVPFLWLGRKSTQDRFIYIPLVGIIVTSILGLLYPPAHAAPWDFFFSWAVIGFVAYSFVVLSAEPLFRLLSRREDYYGEGQVDTGGHDNV